MIFGTACLVKGTEDSVHNWKHYYYMQNAEGRFTNGNGHTNGNADHVEFLVQV